MSSCIDENGALPSVGLRSKTTHSSDRLQDSSSRTSLNSGVTGDAQRNSSSRNGKIRQPLSSRMKSFSVELPDDDDGDATGGAPHPTGAARHPRRQGSRGGGTSGDSPSSSTSFGSASQRPSGGTRFTSAPFVRFRLAMRCAGREKKRRTFCRMRYYLYTVEYSTLQYRMRHFFGGLRLKRKDRRQTQFAWLRVSSLMT